MSEDELKELEALEQAATPGPWVSFADTPDPMYGVVSVYGDSDSDNRIIEICREPEHDERCSDMAFIAESRTALPKLIAEVRILKRYIEHLGAENRAIFALYSQAVDDRDAAERQLGIRP